MFFVGQYNTVQTSGIVSYCQVTNKQLWYQKKKKKKICQRKRYRKPDSFERQVFASVFSFFVP